MNMFGRSVKTAGLAVVVGATLFPALAGAQKVNTDFDHKADFGRYHTFSLIKVEASSPLVEGRLRDGIVNELTHKGMQETPSGGDVSVAATGGRHTEQEYNTFYNNLGGGWGYGGWGRRGWGGWGGGPGQSTTTVQQVPVGSLRIDMFDSGTHQLVWRGIARDQLSDKPEKNTKKLNKALDKMFDKFPPKGVQ